MMKYFVIIIAVLCALVILIKYSPKIISPSTISKYIANSNTLEVKDDQSADKTSSTDYVDINKLTWVTYKNNTTGLEFKYPQSYYRVLENQENGDTCVRLIIRLAYDYEFCYIYNKDKQNEEIEYFTNPLKAANYNPNNYNGTITETTFKNNKAKLMVNNAMQQVPADNLLIYINNKKGELDHLVSISYPKQDIDQYLKLYNEEWGEQLTQYKKETLPISKIILDSVKL